MGIDLVYNFPISFGVQARGVEKKVFGCVYYLMATTAIDIWHK